MPGIIEQFKDLPISKFEIVLQSQTEAVLPALIGSTLRGAFGHALKAIACSMPHRNCEKCFLAEACLYTNIFEPAANGKFKDSPRPFVFEPPIPPLTREISESQTLKIRVSSNGLIAYGLTLIGEAVGKIPYFIYAFDLMARHGLGEKRYPFRVLQVYQVDENAQKHLIYEPHYSLVKTVQNKTLADFVRQRSDKFGSSDKLKIVLQTPLRIRRKDKSDRIFLLEKIAFTEFFKQCSLRLKHLSESHKTALIYDYQNLMEQSGSVKTVSESLWRHDFVRRSNRQHKNLELDGMLGEIEYAFENAESFLPFIIAGEILNIGSSCALGLGKYKLSEAN